MKNIRTLVVVTDYDKILLGMKKTGFGKGRWNGFGGKIETGETILQAAHRELQEEVGIQATAIEERGIITFKGITTFDDSQATDILEVHIFSCTEFNGEPKETEEMKPQWYHWKDIPYSDMWPDDRYWLPIFLEGRSIHATFAFKAENEFKTMEITAGERKTKY